MNKLERASWIAGIVGTVFAIGWGIWTYLKPPEPSAPAQTKTSEPQISGTNSVIIKGSNNVLSPAKLPYNPTSVTGIDSPVTESTSIASVKSSIYPEEISATVRADCLRMNDSGVFINHCPFSIGVTWCYSMGKPEWNDETYQKEYANWSFNYNTCRNGNYYSSPGILPGKGFAFPEAGKPVSPDGKATAGLTFIRAVKLP